MGFFCSYGAFASIYPTNWQTLTPVLEIILGGKCITVCAILLKNVKTRLREFTASVFSAILLKICYRSSHPQEISARSFPFWLMTLCLFFSDPSFRLLSLCRFCLKLQWSGDSCPLCDAFTLHFQPPLCILFVSVSLSLFIY